MIVLWALFLACRLEGEDVREQESKAPSPREWMSGNPPLEEGETSIRTIVHLHSPHSHDACDGEPQPNGILDETCVEDLRQALCELRIDAAFLSDHPVHSVEADDFQELFLLRENDQLIVEEGMLLANQIHCENGHVALIFPGVESSEMMPLALRSHIEGSYDGSEAATVQIEQQGAVKWIAHTEERSVDELLALRLDGLEIYQLHANLDPDIRQEFLGLDSLSYLQEIQPFFFPTEEESDPPQPDLSILGFLRPNEPSIEKMEQVGIFQPIGISGGTDAHQNVFPMDAPDGERIDSYRRMMRWFNTRIEVTQGATAREIVEALRARKTWVVFEVFGTPKGFGAWVDDGMQKHPMGSELDLQQGQVLTVRLPSVSAVSPQDHRIAPDIEGRIYYFDGQVRTEVHRWSAEVAEYSITNAGVYRIEIWIRPKHLQPYLGARIDYAEQWMPWIYSGGFFVRE